MSFEHLIKILPLAFLVFSHAAAGDMSNDRSPHARHLSSFEHHGIDVSHYQDTIDWALVKSNDVSFAFTKATEGLKYVDSKFKKNWTEMKNIGIPRGAYHFFHPKADAKAQALHFIKTVTLEPGDLPPVLDIEVVEGVATKEIEEKIKIWLELVEASYGVKPIIYSSKSFIADNLSSGFNKYPLWIAAYSKSVPKGLGDWESWSIWQHSQSGEIVGINGAVDLSVFSGSKDDLKEFLIPLK